MVLKTISGHFGTVFSLEHNNREFVPQNVDESRMAWNYDCVAVGHEVFVDPYSIRHIATYWAMYRDLVHVYWDERDAAYWLAKREYQEKMRKYREYYRLLYPVPENELESLLLFLLMPLTIFCGIYLSLKRQHDIQEWEDFKTDQWIAQKEFKKTKMSFREALKEYDLKNSTAYLQVMDDLVTEISQKAGHYIDEARILNTKETRIYRYATLEEIYNRFYEPSFREFQAKQRPCRRYNGTYLEQLRERRQYAVKKKNAKADKVRATAEAIEIVFCIGDRDNTGYNYCMDDAKKAERLLKDYADYLMMQPNVCAITTKELDDPNWEPPFRNGLIILNLNVHCDEDTPGIHLTCIPYSRGCQRGPSVQASLGRAMAGMGYPSTWKDVLDENGERIPKRDRKGNIVYNTDGTVRYQLEPDRQGIIDWIEAQKKWIQKEMLERYQWGREYKGSHPRGNLSIPDYKVARAKERQEEIIKATEKHVFECFKSVGTIKDVLETSVSSAFDQSSEGDIIMKYLQMCPEEEYLAILARAEDYLTRLPVKEQHAAKQSFALILENAAKKRKEQNGGFTDKKKKIKIKEENEIG